MKPKSSYNRPLPFSLFSIFCIFSIINTFSQQHQLSPNAEISVLTIGPGASLNDAFGHSAFRINDGRVGMDVVYGYGEYDFDTPNFYLKFAQGKLNYNMSKHSFSDFYNAYVYYDRTIEEQVLNLTPSEKQEVYDYLRTNYLPENRAYLYDFFYDNCATRIRDVPAEAMNKKIDFNTPTDFQAKTFRTLIYEQTGRNNWGSFGIDLALGSVIDIKATPYEHMFLPKYIHEFFGIATLNSSEKLVKTSRVLYTQSKEKSLGSFLFSPLMILGILSILIIYITYSDHKNNKRSRWLDVSLFMITGLLGVFILLLWFATDHTATANNYNLLWAFPLNLLVIGQLMKAQPSPWFKKYLKFVIIMLCLMTLHWIIGVQVFAIGLIPMLVALVVRYVFLLKIVGKGE